jgi:AAA domain
MKHMYGNLNSFLHDVEALHAAHLEQASHERSMRFTGRVIKAIVQGRLTNVLVWVMPDTLNRLVTFGLETGGEISISVAGPLMLGYQPPAPGAVVQGEIHPLQFLILQEAEALARAVSCREEAMRRLLHPEGIVTLQGPVALGHDYGRLNERQREFLGLAAGTPDLALLWGPPGTGKTETIAHVIAGWVGDGHSVLLAAQQHGPLDECLLRLQGIMELTPESATNRWRSCRLPELWSAA